MTGIYKITNLINGKCYIGQAQDIYERWKQHRREFNGNYHHNNYLQNSWNKYGAFNFNFEVICECDLHELDDLEIYYIDCYKSYFHRDDSNGYNMTLGGGGVRGRVLNEDQLSRFKRPCKEETKKKISISNTGANNGMYGKIAGNIIKVICITTNEIFDSAKIAAEKYHISNSSIVACCKRKQKSAGKHIDTFEPLQWMYHSDYVQGKKIDEYARKTPSKKVICINTGEVFDSGLSASEYYGCNKTHISSCCTGKRNYCGKHPETGELLKWAYAI